MSLRSLAIILSLHLHISIYSPSSPHVQPYPYTAGHWHMHPYTIIAFLVHRYVSLTGFVSLPLFWRARKWKVDNQEIHFNTSPDPYRLHKGRIFTCSSFNQVNYQGQRQFRRSTRQRDASQVNNVDNCYKSRDNSYRHPTRGNCIYPIAMSTITIDCSQLSSTKQWRDRDWRERQYYLWTRTTD